MAAAQARPCRRLLVPAIAALVLGTACGGRATPNGAGSTAPGSGAGSSGAGRTTIAGGSGDTADSAGTSATSGAGGLLATSGAGGLLATSGAGGLLASGGGGGTAFQVPSGSDPCQIGYAPLPSDDTMNYGPNLFTPSDGGAADITMQNDVQQWMVDNRWPAAHVIWHAVRGCADGSAASLLYPLGFPNICKDYPALIPQDQHCQSAEDGYQFLLLHRYMIQTLKQLWPKHAADFAGFPKFPTSKAELPAVWNASDPTWNAQILGAAAIADNIEQHLDKFPSEGAVGYWLQCPVGTSAPGFAPEMPYIGLHVNLHDQWSRGADKPHGLNNDQVNVTNYMFWKLHGWIDNAWEKYPRRQGADKAGFAGDGEVHA